MIRYGRVNETEALVDGAVLFERVLAPEEIKTLANGRKMLRPYAIEGGEDFDAGLFVRLGPDIEVEAERVVERHRLEFRPDARQCMCDRIDRRAGEIRLRFKSGGEGQDAVYLMKQAEAEACLAAASVGAVPSGAYPMLEAEVGITAADVVAVAQAVTAKAAAWRMLSAVIEARRLAAKAAVLAAADDRAAQAVWAEAMAESHWPQP